MLMGILSAIGFMYLALYRESVWVLCGSIYVQIVSAMYALPLMKRSVTLKEVRLELSSAYRKLYSQYLSKSDDNSEEGPQTD